ncbi:MAG: nucleotidyltransferase family protein [Clostridia bacterium]|nr:nucleotidyltransferase family protein [Clostridia bacterium]
MSTFGIVCEFNPFHLGHQYLLDEARRRGADRIVCVMSGNTLQRGEFAVADSYARAEATVRCGADLVLELPFPWCSGSAEHFSRAAIAILREFCDTVIFGSECGDLEALSRAAEIASSEEFRAEYRARLSDGAPAAETYFSLLTEYGVGELGSNDLLGVEYLRAARELGADLSFVTVRREGAGYLQQTLAGEEYPSAMALRRLWREGDFSEADAKLPNASAEVFRREREAGHWISAEALDRVVISQFRLHEGEDFSGVVGAEGGLANRICEASKTSSTLDELLATIKTKRYTDARLRRQILFCLAGVTSEVLSSLPSYTTLLAASKEGRALLSEKRKEDGFPIVTNLSDAPKDAPQFRLSERISTVLGLAMTPIADADWQYRKRPYLEREKE